MALTAVKMPIGSRCLLAQEAWRLYAQRIKRTGTINIYQLFAWYSTDSITNNLWRVRV